MVVELLEKANTATWMALVHIASVIAGIHLLLIGGQYVTQPATSLLGEQLAEIGLVASGLALSLDGIVTLGVMLIGVLLVLMGGGVLVYVGKQVLSE